MYNIFIDSPVALEDGMPQLSISVSYCKGSKSYNLHCVPCRPSDYGHEDLYGCTFCAATLETVSRGSTKLETKWNQWADAHKDGILDAFSTAFVDNLSTREAITAYIAAHRDEAEPQKIEAAPQTQEPTPASTAKPKREKPSIDPHAPENRAEEPSAAPQTEEPTPAPEPTPEPQAEEPQQGGDSVKITVNSKKLQGWFKELARIVPSKPSLLILRNIVINASERHGMTLSATDGDIWLDITDKSATIEGECTFCIDAQQAKRFKPTGENTTITAQRGEYDRISVRLGVTSFVSDNPLAFPHVPQSHGKEDVNINFTIEERHKGVEKCATKDELKAVMKGVCIDTDYKHIVASDGHILRAEPTDFDVTGCRMIIPTAAYQMMTGKVLLYFDGDWAMACWDSHIMNFRPIQGRYPGWMNVFEKEMPFRYKFESAAEFLNAAKAMKGVTSSSDPYVKLTFRDGSDLCEMRIDDIDFDVHSSRELKLTEKAQGNFEIGLGVTQLSAVPATWDGTLYTTDHSRAMVFQMEGGGLMLVMPRMLENIDFTMQCPRTLPQKFYKVFEPIDYSKTPKAEPLKVEEPQPTEEPTPAPQPEAVEEPTPQPQEEPKAEEPQPQPTYIPCLPSWVMWLDPDKRQPDMVKAISKYLPIVDTMKSNNLTTYYILNGIVCLETNICMKATGKTITFSFYSGDVMQGICKMQVHGGETKAYSWDEAMQALELLQLSNSMAI